VIAVAIGVAAGLAGGMASEARLAWIGFLSAGAFFAFLIVLTRDKERLLSGLFVLSLQADAAIRFLYGRAGSRGLALHLTFLVGLSVALLWWFSGKRLDTRGLRWSGRLTVPIALLFGWMMFSSLFTSERFTAVTTLVFHLQLYFVYLLGIHLAKTEDDIERILNLLFVCLGIQCVILSVQSVFGIAFTLEGDMMQLGELPRPGGTVSTNPAGFASFVIPILMVALVRFLSAKRQTEQRVLGVLVVLGTLAIGMTYTRVAWFGLMAAMLLVVGLSWTRGLLHGARLTWIAVGLFVSALAFAPGMMERLQQSSVSDAYDERRGLMEIALRIIADNPVVGLGPGAYSQVYKQSVTPGLRQQWLYTVHNEYLLRAAETGILGGAAWVMLLLGGFRLAWGLTKARNHRIRTLGIGWSAGLLAVCWQMYWVPWDGFQYNALLWFFLGLTESAATLRSEQESEDPLILKEPAAPRSIWAQAVGEIRPTPGPQGPELRRSTEHEPLHP